MKTKIEGAFALVAALSVGGCDDGGSVSSKEAPPVWLEYKDCTEQTALLAVPILLMPPLPPGFVYAPPLPGVPLLAGIHVSGSRCESVGGGGPAQDMLAFVLVTPPPELQSPEISAYAMALGGYTSRQATVDLFEAWGLTGLTELGAVDVQLTVTPLARIGQVTARGANSSVTTQMNAVGPALSPGGGYTRAYYAPDGVLVASLDAIYTPQQGYLAVGIVTQEGAGPLPIPLPIYPAIGSHAFGYDLMVGNVTLY